VNSPFGVALVHNGNLVNAAELEKEMFAADKRHINTTSDSELILNVFAHELAEVTENEKVVKNEHVFQAVKKLHTRCSGGYACIGMIGGYGMFAFRDPNGIRPLIFGQKVTPKGTAYMVASESVSLDILGYTVIRDVKPGECVCFPTGKSMEALQCAEKTSHTPCMFEFVYFARPDSMIDGISTYKSRQRMGKKLAEKIMREYADLDIDVVMPIPQSSVTAALEVAQTMNIPYRTGFVKNRYIGRTFIMPGQTSRKKSIRQKLNIIPLEFKGKNVLLVDDSIVRGNTSKQIVAMCRQAGAKKVYFASAAPEVLYPNVYGIDMPTRQELIAHGITVKQVANIIGADEVIYQDLKDLVAAVKEGNPDIDGFDISCFDGVYCTGDVTETYLSEIESARSDAKKDSVVTLL
jgi:amidophosphoribosyltransferase